MVALEHFYYGQLVHYGEPVGERRLVAKSANVTEEMVNAGMRYAMLPPMPTNNMPAWALVRGGRNAPFIMVQSGRGKVGQEMRHMIFIPSDTLRDIHGDLSLLADLLDRELPTYEMLADTLAPLELPTNLNRSLDKQADDILMLMTHTRNNTRNIEPLLSAVVQGVPLIVLNAPMIQKTRTEFVQGLTMLLPSSTRFSVTFATYRQPEDGIIAQISFMDQPPTDETPLIYDWSDGSLRGPQHKDDYSHYITGQLRLDVSLALQQAEALTQIAGWRFKSTGDKLADALAYASKRLRLDNALLTNMPVDLIDASEVLATDPTLSKDLQATYAEHLINFALAMDDMHKADPIAPLLNKNPDISRMTISKFDHAIQESQGTRVFMTLARWMALPDGPRGDDWANLLQLSAVAALQELVAQGDTEGLKQFLDDVRQADPQLGVGRFTPPIIQTVLPLAPRDANLTVRLLALALKYLPDEAFNRLMESDAFKRHLSGPVTRYLDALKQTGKPEAPLLATAAESLGDSIKPVALRRLTELAYNRQRLDLIDTPALAELLRLSVTEEGRTHSLMLSGVMLAINNKHIQDLAEPGPRLVLQVLLALGRYDLLARAMIDQSRDLYSGERQYDFLRMVQEIFAKTPLHVEDVPAAIRGIEDNGIKGVTLLVAAAGALESTHFAIELKGMAQRLLEQIQESPNYQEVIQPEVIMSLIRYYSHHGVHNGVRAATAIMPAVAAAKDNKEGLSAINRTFQMIWKTDAYRPFAYDMLRQYIRSADDAAARRTVEYFGKELGRQRGYQLRVSYVFGQFMGGLDITTYAEVLHTVIEVLTGHAQLFEDRDNMPNHRQLSTFKQALYTNMNLDERHQFGEDIRRIALAILHIGNDFDRHSKRTTRYTDNILKGEEDPNSITDVLHAAGGYLAQGRYYRLKLRAADSYGLLEASQPGTVQFNIGLTAELLTSMIEALPPDRKLSFTFDDIKSEIDSLMRSLPRDEMQKLRKQFATDWQQLAELVMHMYDKADKSIMDSNNRTGAQLDTQKRLPANSLELYRMLSSFFLGD